MAGEDHFWCFTCETEVKIMRSGRTSDDVICALCHEEYVMEFDPDEDYVMGGDEGDDDILEEVEAFDVDGGREVREGPATVDELMALPRLVLMDADEDMCIVCRENYRDKVVIIQMPCGHIFHEECLLPWLTEEATCPICRRKLRSE